MALTLPYWLRRLVEIITSMFTMPEGYEYAPSRVDQDEDVGTPDDVGADEEPQPESAGALAQPVWMTIAEAELGVHEVKGVNHNARILEYHKATWLKATEDEVPWCAAFVSWVLLRAGCESPMTPRARDFANASEVVAIDEARHGAIVVMTRKGGGHVGFLVDKRGDKIRVLGGNQSDSVNIATYPASRVVAYRWPKQASA